MSRYDRYVLSQLLLLFGLFSLILVGVFWINRAVTLFDRLIADGQSAMVFLEFSALSLPNLIRIVLPIAVFAASVYITNRLNSESELTVMQSTGCSPWRMARPVLVFGLTVGVMMTILSHLLLPAATAQLKLRELEVSQNASARLLNEGTFLHPSPGVTFYIRSIDEDGALNDVFLSDRRNPDETLTYTALRAFLVRDEDNARLIMVDGLAQRLITETQTLSTTNFRDFSYDISALMRSAATPGRGIRELGSWELLTDADGLASREGFRPGDLAEELHLRFARALICVAVALIGFSALQIGAFSRFGVWRQILMAVFVLIVLEMLRGIVSEPVLADARKWPLIYLPALLGMVIAAVFLWLAAHPVVRRRAEVTP
ncbi:LPS export ABC transporter permease LptF [Aestuariivita boseongensis]|uniref:LPS export ABC transporter permease LptF n=1 Tax=Aestuariivita boseongensis TaxID=1470562 RepID=UPI0006818795|nr:LPS export ABC transporter permease LptF [Aestuariivita boseongensis]